jgi:poly(3-hydroxybutyrate) depolymerase
MSRYLLSLALFFFLLPAADAGAAKIRIVVKTPGGLEQRVYLTRPNLLASDRPIVFVMHGMKRNADEYRDQWHELAKKHEFLLVVPEFNERHFPGAEAYNLGNIFDSDGKVRPRADWSFSAIEPIFDEVRRRYGMTARGYALYGHSAGAQFVHRFLYHVPNARVTRVVAANAGWYTMPVFNVEYPYGLRNSVVSSMDLAAALQLPVTVLLGDQDIDPQHRSLNREPEALLQGAHRFERGHAFFDSAADAAGRLGVPFGWRLVVVPGADHDNRLMAPAAIPLLLEGSAPPRPRSIDQTTPETETLPDQLPVTGR